MQLVVLDVRGNTGGYIHNMGFILQKLVNPLISNYLLHSDIITSLEPEYLED